MSRNFPDSTRKTLMLMVFMLSQWSTASSTSTQEDKAIMISETLCAYYVLSVNLGGKLINFGSLAVRVPSQLPS